MGANLYFLELVVDIERGTDFADTRPNRLHPLPATEFLNQKRQVRFSLWGSIRIEKEGSPPHYVLEFRMTFPNQGDCPSKSAKANKAPRANDVRDDFDS